MVAPPQLQLFFPEDVLFYPPKYKAPAKLLLYYFSAQKSCR